MNNTNRGTVQQDSDVHITYEDQMKINHFARYNARFEDYRTEIKNKENEQKSLEDALEELILMDDDESTKLPYLNGDVFVYKTISETQAALNLAIKGIEEHMKAIVVQREELKGKMNELKTQLYAKFGTQINLEADDE